MPESPRICFDKIVFIAVILILMGLTAYTVATYKDQKGNVNCSVCPTRKTPRRKLQQEIKRELRKNLVPGVANGIAPPDTVLNEQILDQDPVMDYDYRKITDILMEPTRRFPRHTLPPNYLMSMYTRGYPDNYTTLGYLHRETPGGRYEEQRLPLFGRQIYPGSYQWQYFVTTTNLGVNIKIPFDIPKNNQELQNGDIIKLKEFDNAEYRVKLYKMDQPVYNPYVLYPPANYPGY